MYLETYLSHQTNSQTVISFWTKWDSYNDQNVEIVKQLITGIRSLLWKWHNTVIPPTAKQVAGSAVHHQGELLTVKPP